MNERLSWFSGAAESSDYTIVSLSTDDPPIVTAVAPGTATISAGGASADVTVYAGSSLPLGTVLWSNPGDGSGVQGLYVAVPSDSGVDVFSAQNDGSVQATRTDGSVAWINSSLPASTFNQLIPDFNGGAAVWANYGQSIFSLDHATGAAGPAYNATTDEAKFWGLGNLAVHTDGTVFTIDYSCSHGNCPYSSDATDGAWVVGIDPTSGAAKFKVPVANETVQGSAANSFCNGTSGSTTSHLHSWPANPMMIAGDGYAYTNYLTEDSMSFSKKSATQPWPDAAYPAWDTLRSDTEASNFTAALADYIVLAEIVGWDPNPGDIPLGQALQSGDLNAATLIENSIAPQFVRHCDEWITYVYKLHFMRVGSDGTSSDVVAQQWTRSESTVYAPTPGDSSNYTDVQAGPLINLNGVFMITNADQGAVFSWSVTKFAYCALATDAGCTAQVGTVNENHITTMAGGTVTGDVILNWALPGQFEAVQPVLQLADGSFIGTVNGQTGGNMLAFNSSGNVTWVVPNFTPQMATADGGIIASAPQICNGNGCTPGTVSTFDSNGNPTGQTSANENSFDWPGNQSYAPNTGTTTATFGFPPDYAPTYTALGGSNQSSNGTAIWQVLSSASQSNSPQKQLPPTNAALGTNYNAIEILTTVSPDTIFSSLIQTFEGAGNPPPGQKNPNSVADIINAPPPPVTASGQTVTFRLKSWRNYAGCLFQDAPCPLQGPFSVVSERVDSVAHTVSVATLTGHPLAGWRYWRVFSVGTNDLVIETGAVDTAYGSWFIHPVNNSGYFIMHGDQLQMWEDDLRYILSKVQSLDAHAVQRTQQQYNVVHGAWNPATPTKTYLLNNICQSTICN